jgi:hypothetical protein
MAYIEWEDAGGTNVLTPTYPAGPARRFREWVPDVKPVGPFKFSLGTGRRYQFQFRRDYQVSLTMPGLAPNQFTLFHDFKIFALSGCAFYVYCEDADNNFYSCRLAEGSEPELSMSDDKMIEYTLKLVVKNVDDAPMLCNYRSA